MIISEFKHFSYNCDDGETRDHFLSDLVLCEFVGVGPLTVSGVWWAMTILVVVMMTKPELNWFRMTLCSNNGDSYSRKCGRQWREERWRGTRKRREM